MRAESLKVLQEFAVFLIFILLVIVGASFVFGMSMMAMDGAVWAMDHIREIKFSIPVRIVE